MNSCSIIPRCFVFLATACVLLNLGGVAEAAAPDEHVILITIDGFAATLYHDQKVSLPNLRKLAEQGVAAQGMRAANPTVTWPNHTTLITGVRAATHSVLFNGVLTKGQPGLPLTIDPKKDKVELVTGPNLFDLAHAAGLRTAAINWPCTRNSAAIQDDFPDTPETLKHTTPRLREEMVGRHIIADAKDATFRALTGPARDEAWTEAACLVIRERKPNFLVLHLLNTDGIHHRYGPDTPASHTALALADQYVGRIVQAVRSAGLESNTTIFVTADHGFATATNLLHPNALFRKAGLLRVGLSNAVVEARAQAISEGGTGFIYLNDPATASEDAPKIRELLAKQEGVAELIESRDFAKHGLPAPSSTNGMCDFVLVAKPGYAISAAATGDAFVRPVVAPTNAGYHGYIATNPRMNPLFIASGKHIVSGKKIDLIDNVDVATTIAEILHLQLPKTDGRVLQEILRP